MDVIAQVRQLLREGKHSESEQLCEGWLKENPYDTEALNLVALSALRRRDFDKARALLLAATAADAAHYHSHFHLGRVHEEAGRFSEAIEAYRTAVRLQPESFDAGIRLAAALDRSGEHAAALQEYALAIGKAQRVGHWLNPQTTPNHIKPVVEQGLRAIAAAKIRIAADSMSQLRSRFGAAELRRVERAVRVYLREEAAERADPNQQPTAFYFPGIPATPYIDLSLIKEISSLEATTDAIRDELAQVLDANRGRERVFLDQAVERANLRGTEDAPADWSGYYFYRHGARREENCAACPSTARTIDALPLSRVPAHGPEVLFSIFTPGTHLLPHRGVTNTRIVGHLPLIVPAHCALKVGGIEHAWVEGRVVLFDDTYLHEAWNRSDSLRVVLIFDLWSPYLSEVERISIAALTSAFAEIRAFHE